MSSLSGRGDTHAARSESTSHHPPVCSIHPLVRSPALRASSTPRLGAQEQYHPVRLRHRDKQNTAEIIYDRRPRHQTAQPPTTAEVLKWTTPFVLVNQIYMQDTAWLEDS